MKKVTGVIVIVTAAIILATVVFAREKTEQIELNRVAIGYIPITGNLDIFVAVEKGYFKERGLNIELAEFASANDAMNAVIAGRIAMAGAIGIFAPYSVQQKFPDEFKLILTTVQTERNFAGYIIVRKDSSIRSIQDLKGKKVGIFPPSANAKTLVKMVFKQFMDPEKDVQFIPISPRLQIQALEAGQFDALFTIEPYPTIAVEKGIARVLVENPRTKYILNPFPVAGSPISTTFIRKNPNTTKAIITALNKAVDFIRTNEKEARSILTKYTPLTRDMAQKCNMSEWRKLDEIDKKAHQQLAEIFFEAGLLDGKINTNELFLTESDLK